VARVNCGRLTGGTLVYGRGKWATRKTKFGGTIKLNIDTAEKILP